MATRVLAYSDSKVFGGAEAVFCDIVEGLRRRPGLDLAVAAPAANGDLIRRLRGSGGEQPLDVPAQALPLAAFDLHNPLRLRAVRKVVSDVDPDVLLVNLPSAEYGPTPLRLELPGVRGVGLLHVSGSPRDLGFHLGAARERLARRALSSLDVACVLSEGAAEFFRARWSGGETTVQRISLPRPRVERIARAEARRRLGLDEDRTWIGIAGRISLKQKGQETFARGAARPAGSAGTKSRPCFAVAGEGRDREALERLVGELGIADAFRFLGPVRPIDAFLGAIDAIAIPSRFEGLPLIALEAIEAGVPGIATAIDGIREVWPGDWLVAPDDPEALAAALARLLDMEDAVQRGMLETARQEMETMTAEDPAAAVAEILER